MNSELRLVLESYLATLEYRASRCDGDFDMDMAYHVCWPGHSHERAKSYSDLRKNCLIAKAGRLREELDGKP